MPTPPLPQRLCTRPGCGQLFMPRRRWQIYCSDQCRALAYHIRMAEKWLMSGKAPQHATPIGNTNIDPIVEAQEAIARAKEKKITGPELDKILFKDFTVDDL